jgi:hypothetical protein
MISVLAALLQTNKKLNSYFGTEIRGLPGIKMFKKLKELYNEYKPYVRVDLIMYGVLILSIIIYFIISAILG